ncbi:amyloid-beta A4 precursor protein-binding family A member 2 isoform X2 [Bufo gargarizans]|uniref:amyloid-beta A4 precursor protein-binding family A member 2 isoform X2 n=1 Tax=Bufo gargarizans TaxID=30331 RepID=UPI001CF4A9C4|nr:amyloid-beta A4 precursor protein-binding family A member 2 isoform X2 [Bufo gargarizans]
MLSMASRKRHSTRASMLDQRPRSCPSSPQILSREKEDSVYEEETVVHEYTNTQLHNRHSASNQEEQDCNDNSGDGDSSSDYVNNTSDEEYDEGLPDEEEGITYYIRYCPEDDSYLEGMDCNGEEYVHTEENHVDTDECVEAVEDEWTESKLQQQECIEGDVGQENQMQILEEDNSSSLEVQDQEETAQYSENEEVYQDYYPVEANGNSLPQSPFQKRKTDGNVEDQEEDIDQIVAEIKMSMSMSSINSTTDMSPEHVGTEIVPIDHKEICQKTDAGHSANRHESRPKSLNIPSASKHGDIQRSYKTKVRTPEERQKWSQEQETKKVATFPSFVDVPGPCEPEDLIDGIIFAANFLGSTQLLSERNPSKNIRMMQAQEAVSRVKNSEGDSQTLTEVDLFISTQRIKVLNADTQETMMDHALRTISYIADIGNIVVLMARRRMPRSASQDCIETTPGAQEGKKQYKMICHVFESEDAQLIAQSIGQAFSVAYQEFLRANGINPEDLSQKEYSDIINTQEMYNDDLIHFSNSENCKELQVEKLKGEILGVVVVESGWGSILPTVILANMMNGGPAARSGKLSIGDQIMSINGTSLVGLPLATCQGIIKGLKNQTQLKLNIVSCPPVTTVLIKRPDLKYQLGFSVQNGIICSLMRGGIAERGGVRVGHRIIEINGQSVVATAHEKIVQALSNSVGEIHMKTMPAAMFRLLTGQETPLYI